MEPRIAFRTHYQVHEPAYLKFLILECASPVQSAYREVLGTRLAEEMTRLGKDLNPPAGAYAVDLAQDLNLLTPNNVWADKAHLMNLITKIRSQALEEDLALTLPEKLLYFHIFLEGDGAALIYIAKKLLAHGSVVDSEEDWNMWARDMFAAVFSDYLDLTANTADRVKLRREVDRIRSRGYEGNTGSHKMYIHLQTLTRLGLVIRDETGAARSVKLPAGFAQGGGLAALVQRIPTVKALEDLVAERQWIEVASDVFQLSQGSMPAQPPTMQRLMSLVASYYAQAMSTGISICPLSALIGAIQISALSGSRHVLPYSVVLNLLIAAQKVHRKEMRFHVDRRGQPAFLRLSESLVKYYEEGQGA